MCEIAIFVFFAISIHHSHSKLFRVSTPEQTQNASLNSLAFVATDGIALLGFATCSLFGQFSVSFAFSLSFALYNHHRLSLSDTQMHNQNEKKTEDKMRERKLLFPCDGIKICCCYYQDRPCTVLSCLRLCNFVTGYLRHFAKPFALQHFRSHTVFEVIAKCIQFFLPLSLSRFLLLSSSLLPLVPFGVVWSGWCIHFASAPSTRSLYFLTN